MFWLDWTGCTAVSGHSDGALWDRYIRLELVRRHCCISKLPWQCHSPFHCLLALSSSKVIGSNNHRDSVLYTYSNWELFPASSSTFKCAIFIQNAAFHWLHHKHKGWKALSEFFFCYISCFTPLKVVWWIAAYYAVVLLKQSSLGIQGFIRAQCEIIQLKPIFNQLHVHNGTRKTDVLQWIPHRALLVTLGDIAMFYFIICFMLSCFKAVKGH